MISGRSKTQPSTELNRDVTQLICSWLVSTACAGALNEEMGNQSGDGRHLVDGIRVQQIVALSSGEQLSGSVCGNVGAVSGHRPVHSNHSGFQYLAGADKWPRMDFGGFRCPLESSLAVTVRSMSVNRDLSRIQLAMMCD